jgi:hypothetical protein
MRLLDGGIGKRVLVGNPVLATLEVESAVVSSGSGVYGAYDEMYVVVVRVEMVMVPARGPPVKETDGEEDVVEFPPVVIGPAVEPDGFGGVGVIGMIEIVRVDVKDEVDVSSVEEPEGTRESEIVSVSVCVYVVVTSEVTSLEVPFVVGVGGAGWSVVKDGPVVSVIVI